MSENRRPILSDLERSDAYVLTEADYEEIPEVTDEMLDRAVFHPAGSWPEKAGAADLRLEPDVAHGLKASGDDWQRQGNAVLRDWLKSRAA